MRFELFIALRYLMARRKQAFISLISLISMVGVAVGVMALIIALALMTGLQGELRDRILGSTAHVYVWKRGGFTDPRADIQRIMAIPGVVGAGPAIMGAGVLLGSATEGFITVKGVDPELEPNVTDIRTAMIDGSITALAEESDEHPPGILLGRELAEKLQVRVGDSVHLLTTTGTLTPMGMSPRTPRLRVVGIYAMGLYDVDAMFGFVSLDFAKRLMGKEVPDVVQVRLTDVYAAPAMAARIGDELGPDYDTQDWTVSNGALFSALWLEKMGLSIAIGLIVTVAALNIVASLILLVMEKSRDIAILKTMGLSSGRVMQLFMLQGLIIGAVGTTVGGLGGLILCRVLDKYQLIKIPMDVYQVSYVPFIVEPADFTIVVTAAVLISFLATIYPSRQASRLDPVQALRFE